MLSFLSFIVASGILATLVFRLFVFIMFAASPCHIAIGPVLAISGIIAYIAMACTLRYGLERTEEPATGFIEKLRKRIC